MARAVWLEFRAVGSRVTGGSWVHEVPLLDWKASVYAREKAVRPDHHTGA